MFFYGGRAREGRRARAQDTTCPPAPVPPDEESECTDGGLGTPATFFGEGLEFKTTETVTREFLLPASPTIYSLEGHNKRCQPAHTTS